MIELKTGIDLLKYDYRVCEILTCTADGIHVYSDEEETKSINVCHVHYKHLQEIKFW